MVALLETSLTSFTREVWFLASANSFSWLSKSFQYQVHVVQYIHSKITFLRFCLCFPLAFLWCSTCAVLSWPRSRSASFWGRTWPPCASLWRPRRRKSRRRHNCCDAHSPRDDTPSNKYEKRNHFIILVPYETFQISYKTRRPFLCDSANNMPIPIISGCNVNLFFYSFAYLARLPKPALPVAFKLLLLLLLPLLLFHPIRVASPCRLLLLLLLLFVIVHLRNAGRPLRQAVEKVSVIISEAEEATRRILVQRLLIVMLAQVVVFLKLTTDRYFYYDDKIPYKHAVQSGDMFQ